MGTGADGRSRRLEVGLCIMWPAIAVTVSLLSLSTEGGPIPTALICRLDTVSPPPFSRNHPRLVNCGIMKGDSADMYSSFSDNVKEAKCSSYLLYIICGI